MFHALGKEVIYLKRIRIGSIVLDPTLEEGTYRRLTAGEVAALEKMDICEISCRKAAQYVVV